MLFEAWAAQEKVYALTLCFIYVCSPCPDLLLPFVDLFLPLWTPSLPYLVTLLCLCCTMNITLTTGSDSATKVYSVGKGGGSVVITPLSSCTSAMFRGGF